MNPEKNRSSTSLISDTVTVKTLRDFLAAPKPTGMTPVDILHVIQLTIRKAEDHEIFDAQKTLADAFCCDVKTIVRSQQRLAKLKWISRPQRKGRTNALSLNIANIPTERLLRTLITPTANELAMHYQRGLQRRGRKKFPNAWFSQQTLSAQRILDRCGGDIRLAAIMIKHALDSPIHQRKAKKSLYELLGRWRKVEQTYGAENPAQLNPIQVAQETSTAQQHEEMEVAP